MHSLVLPGNSGDLQTIKTERSILLVGANGSGKTRLGTWIELEKKQKARVHRISAQKSLDMPDSTTPMSIEIAERNLLFGDKKREDLVAHYRWNQRPATSLLNDYEKLMVYLFSDETEENAKYKAASVRSTERIEPPRTKLDTVKGVWETVLPHRELVVGGLRIETRVRGQAAAVYKSSEMSDGERVIFYLIGQCLAAPKDGIIIIDEPKLHLHKSIQPKLWSEIEKIRSDCLFVYLTHDVDFAAANECSTKIWLKSFDGTNWEWEPIAPDSNLPDELLFELLGSRKPVVFVEGEAGSYDTALYRAVLSDYLVIPRGGCENVIQSVKALKSNSQLHHLDVSGLIDKDRRMDAEISALREHSIFVMSVAEVENLFCTKEVLALASERLARDPVADFEAVSTAIFKRLQSELEKQVSLHAIGEIKFRLNCYDARAVGKDELESALRSLAAGINVDSLYQESLTRFEKAIHENDFEALLRLYNRKSLSDQAGKALGLASHELPELVIRLAQSDSGQKVRDALARYLEPFQINRA
jgi:energy-coupling factor transporter ATP-binding protein EcfA2